MAKSKAARKHRYQMVQNRKKAQQRLENSPAYNWVELDSDAQPATPEYDTSWTYAPTGALPFFSLPAEIRNQIYDYMVPNLQTEDLTGMMLPGGPLTLPVSKKLLTPRLISHQFDEELLHRLYDRGIVLRLNLVPQNVIHTKPPFTLLWETSQTRMELRGTCASGVRELIAELAGESNSPYYRSFADGIPPRFIRAARSCIVKILFKSCCSVWRCSACKRYRFEKNGDGASLFDIDYVLATLCNAWRVILKDTGRTREKYPAEDGDKGEIVHVDITQEGNWLGWDKRRFLERGDRRDVWICVGHGVKIDYSRVLRMKNKAYDDDPPMEDAQRRNKEAEASRGEVEKEIEQCLADQLPDVRLSFRIVTTCNPGDDD